MDNCSDNYHVPTTHLSSATVQTRYPGRPRLSHKDQFESPNKYVFVNGHALTFREVSDDTPRYVHGMSRETFALFQEYHDLVEGDPRRRAGPIGVQEEHRGTGADVVIVPRCSDSSLPP